MKDHSSRRKVAILHQGFVPVYRVRFYEMLSQVSDIQYVVFHGSPLKNLGHREFTGTLNFPNSKVKNIEVPLLGRNLVYQPVLKEILLGCYSAVILGHELKFISSLALFFLFRMADKPIIWWRHGFE